MPGGPADPRDERRCRRQWRTTRRATTRVWTVPNLLSMLRLAGVPVFLWLVLGPEADGWALALLMLSGRHRLPRRLPRPPAQPDLACSARSSTRSPTGSTSSPSSSASPCATSSRGGSRSSLPLRDLLLWGLVPLLRTRGYSALPVHFLGKAATFNLLYAFPLLLLGDGDGVVGHAGQGVRLGVRVLGDRALLVGRDPLRLAGPQAARDHRAPYGGRAMPDDAPTGAPDAAPLPEQVTMPLLTADHPAVARRGLPARRRSAARRAATRRRPRGRPHRVRRPS